MRYLLDTHILLWVRSAPGKLSAKGVEILQSADNELYVSVVVSRLFCKNQQQWARGPARTGRTTRGERMPDGSCRLVEGLYVRHGSANHADPVE